MKKYLLFVFLILLPVLVYGQNSAITATITDSDGQTWNSGTYKIEFVGIQGVSTYYWNGTVLSIAQQTYTGNMSSSGVITKTVPDSSFISPSGTQWRFTICSQTSAPCSTIVTSVVGAFPNMSSTLSAAVKAPRVTAGPGAYAYSNTEVITPQYLGGTYYNVTSQQTFLWNGTAWVVSSTLNPVYVTTDNTDQTASLQAFLNSESSKLGAGQNGTVQFAPTGYYTKLLGVINWPPNLNLVMCGMTGHNQTTVLPPPPCGFDLESSTTTGGKINLLYSGTVIWQNVSIVDKAATDTNHSPELYLTRTIMHGINISFQGVGANYNAQTDAITFGGHYVGGCSSDGNINDCFAGYGTTFDTTFFDHIRHPAIFQDTANAITFNNIVGTVYNGCSTDGTIATVCPAFISNAEATKPAYADVFNNIVWEMGSNQGINAQTYSYAFDLNNYWTSGIIHGLVTSENYSAVAAVHIGTTGVPWSVECSSGAYTGQVTGCVLDDNFSSLGNDIDDTYKRVFVRRNTYFGFIGDGTTPVNKMNYVLSQCTYPYNTSTLPACNATNKLAKTCVSDATVATPGSAYVGGGTYTIDVQCVYNSTGSVYTWNID